jgi:prophage antirepressor-like protein
MKLVKTENQFKHQIFGNLTTIVNELNEVFFVGKEVTEKLGYSNSSEALSDHVREKHKVKMNNSDLLLLGVDAGRKGEILISEPGLYSLILSSKLPDAEKFQDWVVEEVLPSIRKNGIYATEVTVDKMLNDPDFAIALLTNLKNEKKLRQEAENKNAVLMHVNKTYTSTELAKELGMLSAIQLNTELSKLKIQYKQNGTYVLYSQYAGHGYDQIKQEVLDSGRVVYHRRWTQLGRTFIINLFKNP